MNTKIKILHENKPILSIREKIGFGMGDAACNMVWGAITMFLTYFYTDIFGLAPALVGTLLLSVRIIDAITDPLMGAIADRTKTRWGRFRPYLLWCAIPFAIASVLMYSTPDWSYNAKVIYAVATYSLMSLIYTAVNIPYCALGSVISSNPEDRVSCQSYRFVLAGFATLIVSLTLLPMVDWIGGGDKAKGFQYAMMILSIIALFMFLFAFANIKERIIPVVNTNDNIKNDLRDVWKNDQWVRILLLTFFNVCPGFIRMAAVIFYIKYVMQEPSTQFATIFISLGVIAMMFGSAIAKPLTDKFCKLKVFFYANLVLALLSFGFYFVNPAQTTLVIVLYIVLCFIHQIPSPLHWSLMADVDDYGEWKTGKRITGISFSGNLFFLKLGLAVAGALVGWLLAIYGYKANVAIQSDRAILGITLLFTIIPAVCYLITAGVVRLLKVDRVLMAQIQNDLQQRREDAE